MFAFPQSPSWVTSGRSSCSLRPVGVGSKADIGTGEAR